jgi:hypothetical protein
MTRSGEKEIYPDIKSAYRGQTAGKCDSNCCYGYERGEEKRVREPTMAPKITVSDAELESNDIKIVNNGTKGANRPDPFWNPRCVEASSNAECRHCVGED